MAIGPSNLASGVRNAVRSKIGGTGQDKATVATPTALPPSTPKKASAYLANTNVNRMLGTVPFQFDPNTVKVGHMPETRSVTRALGVPQAEEPRIEGGQRDQKDAVVNVGDTTIAFGEIVFDGPQTQAHCDLLLNWTYPYADGMEDRTPLFSMPLIEFRWDGFTLGFMSTAVVQVVLSKVDVDYCRFTADGHPTRAKVALSAKIKVSEVKRQNPTSGGPPSRRGHVVIEGENLPSIAKDRYGSTANWRKVAAANGIADPLRVRPGQRLYLPARAELNGGHR